jgi:hypothetical protein
MLSLPPSGMEWGLRSDIGGKLESGGITFTRKLIVH